MIVSAEELGRIETCFCKDGLKRKFDFGRNVKSCDNNNNNNNTIAMIIMIIIVIILIQVIMIIMMIIMGGIREIV